MEVKAIMKENKLIFFGKLKISYLIANQQWR